MVGLLLAVVVSEISPCGRDDKARAGDKARGRRQGVGAGTRRGRGDKAWALGQSAGERAKRGRVGKARAGGQSVVERRLIREYP
jgi:hypothetical protein